jgi:hypothetical protein
VELSDAREDAIWRNFGKWAVAFLLFLAMSVMFVSLMLLQITAEGASKRTLRRSVAALTEIDPLLDRNYDGMQQQAQAAKAGDTIEMPNFPIAVVFTPDEVRGASKEQVRDMLLNRSADVLYDDGASAFRDAAGPRGSVGRFSIGGVTDHGLGFLRGRNHDILAFVTIVMAVICGGLAIALAMLCRGFGRIGSIGAVVIAAAIPLATFGIGARFYMRIVSDGDASYIEREFLEIGQGLAWIPIRDGLAFLVLGVVFAATGLIAGRWSDRRRDERSAYDAAHPYAR